MATKPWNGQGNPPNKAAAVAWMKSQGVPDSSMAYAWSPNSPDKPTGDDARQLVATWKAEQTGTARPSATSTARPAATSSGAPGSAAAAIAAGPTGAGVGDKGYALLPYQGGGAFTANVLPSLQIRDATTGQPGSVRYFEGDAVAPATWSPEKVAKLQQQMMTVGLYGATKTKLGTWGEQDFEAYKMLLTAANVSGRTSDQQLSEWSIRPPDAATLHGLGGPGGGTKGTVVLSNPTDIRATAETVSQNLLGHVDRGFVNAAPPAYQAQEQAAGDAQVANASAGGGGTVTQAPTQANFLQDKLQREHPIEVDANSFLNTFDNFRKILGAQ